MDKEVCYITCEWSVEPLGIDLIGKQDEINETLIPWLIDYWL